MNRRHGEPTLRVRGALHLRRRACRGFTLVELLTVCMVLAILAAILVPRFWRAYNRSQYSACTQNVKNVATALESYCTDNGRVYPTNLEGVVPQYLKVLPSCPAASGVDTYTPSYTKIDDPATFTVFCNGGYHAILGYAANSPWYQAGVGLGP